VRRVGDEVVLSACPPAAVQSLIDALDDFEPGVQLQREQPQADERAPIRPRR
jgi:hypothetical protein